MGAGTIERGVCMWVLPGEVAKWTCVPLHYQPLREAIDYC